MKLIIPLFVLLGTAVSFPSFASSGDLISASQSLPWVLGGFFAIGLGLALTPCVYPMYPIISGVVVADRNASTKRTLALGMAYVQGMALTYTLLGLAVAMLGAQFQAYIQHPAVIGIVAALFILLALAMFDMLSIQMPSKWQAYFANRRARGGSIKGAFIIGAISGLIASPCTTAPLSGALLYVAQQGDLVVGATALYLLSLGMGVPLIAFAVGGKKLMPKAGAWMNGVKYLFGFVMLFMAATFLERLVPNGYSIATFMVLISIGVAALIYKRYGISRMAMAMVALIALTAYTIDREPVASTPYQLVESLDEITEVAASNVVLLDFYADWCVSCKKMERTTFTDPEIISLFGSEKVNKLRIDATQSSTEKSKIMQEYQVMGMPTFIVLVNGEEFQRYTGEASVNELSKTLNDALH